MSGSQTKVIVVGGGPVGLIAAHILSKAHIDFVLLERGPTVTPEPGSSLALYPHTDRILDQLRLLEPLQPFMNPMAQKIVATQEGDVFSTNNVFELAKENHGYNINMFHRHELLKGFYDNLPAEAKAKILVNKRVVRIEPSSTSVRVHAADGTVEEGSIVVGADGVHSTIRNQMHDLAVAAAPDDASIEEANPFESTYRVMFGNAPRHPLLQPGRDYESHGRDSASQVFVGRDRLWFFLYRKLAHPTKERKSYTQAEADEYAASWGDLQITPGLLFRDLYPTRNGSGLTNLEEGVLKRWSWGRVVLVGDAAHKVTPNLGWGFNSGVQDLVVLINHLRRAIMAKRDDEQLDAKDIEAVFAAYQAERMDFMVKIADISGTNTRTTAWAGRLRQMLDYYVFPAVGADILLTNWAMGPMLSSTPVLEWLEEEHFAEGKIKWKHGPVAAKADEPSPRPSAEDLKSRLVPVLLSASVMAGIAASWGVAQVGLRTAMSS